MKARIIPAYSGRSENAVEVLLLPIYILLYSYTYKLKLLEKKKYFKLVKNKNTYIEMGAAKAKGHKCAVIMQPRHLNSKFDLTP